jgi:hypothetical protein
MPGRLRQLCASNTPKTGCRATPRAGRVSRAASYRCSRRAPARLPYRVPQTGSPVACMRRAIEADFLGRLRRQPCHGVIRSLSQIASALIVSAWISEEEKDGRTTQSIPSSPATLRMDSGVDSFVLSCEFSTMPQRSSVSSIPEESSAGEHRCAVQSLSSQGCLSLLRRTPVGTSLLSPKMLPRSSATQPAREMEGPSRSRRSQRLRTLASRVVPSAGSSSSLICCGP